MSGAHDPVADMARQAQRHVESVTMIGAVLTPMIGGAHLLITLLDADELSIEDRRGFAGDVLASHAATLASLLHRGDRGAAAATVRQWGQLIIEGADRQPVERPARIDVAFGPAGTTVRMQSGAFEP